MNTQLQKYVDQKLSRVGKDRKKLSKPLADIIRQLSSIKKDIEKYDVLIQWGLVTVRACQYNQKLALLCFQSKVFEDLKTAIEQDDVQSVVSYYEKRLDYLKITICAKCEIKVDVQTYYTQQIESNDDLTTALLDITTLEDLHSVLEKAHFLTDVLKQVKAMIEVDNETH